MNTNINNISTCDKTPLSTSLEKNSALLSDMFKNCDDIKSRNMHLGSNADVKATIYYVEVAINNITIEESVIGKLLSRLMGMNADEIYDYLSANALGITDVKELETLEDAVMGVMIGDGVLFIDGYDKAIKIKSKGYPMMGVGSSQTEKVIRGSREGFSDALKANTALMRKRVRNNSFKVREFIIGNVTNTTVAITYVDGMARPRILNEIEKRIRQLKIEGLTDSGIIEQLAGENNNSIFPVFQTTERPDRAALAVMQGRIALFVDNSPVALLLPSTIGCFFQTADDYYAGHMVVTLARIIRYMAAFLALTFPALYLAVVSFHPELLPGELENIFNEARKDVPFSPLLEVLIMEFSFELLKEAGVRVPGPMGSTIGIVGGLIVGQSAVTAGLVSPIIVVVVAITALSSFAVTNEELSSALRLFKYFLIILSFCFGLFGVIGGLLIILTHMAKLNSFDFPYLMPFVSDEIYYNDDLEDSVVKTHPKKQKISFFNRKRSRNRSK